MEIILSITAQTSGPFLLRDIKTMLRGLLAELDELDEAVVSEAHLARVLPWARGYSGIEASNSLSAVLLEKERICDG